MIQSMTGYGHSSLSSPKGSWSVEIHSVNRKALDINISMPQELLAFDVDIRTWIKKEIERGHVSVRISFKRSSVQNLETDLFALKSKWDEACLKLGLDPVKNVDLSFLCKHLNEKEGSIVDDFSKEDLQNTFQIALRNFLVMREKEGQFLAEDIKNRLHTILAYIEKIEENRPNFKTEFEQKLKDKLKEVLEQYEESRVLREIIMYAEKFDIAEEVTRLHCHIDQFENFMNGSAKNVGKTLDFLSQEMGREINTILAKLENKDLLSVAVAIRAELERIREQIQNIE